MLAPSLILAISMMAAVGPDTVVVSPPHYLDALRPWVAHRTAQGHRFAFVSNAGSAEQIRDGNPSTGTSGPLKYILLVGDAEPVAAYDPFIRMRCVPAFMADAKVNIRWRSTPELPTDNWYADLDDDGVPDVAIGRLPADSPQELALMRGEDPGLRERSDSQERGVSGSTSWPASVVLVRCSTRSWKWLPRSFSPTEFPPSIETSMTYGSWRSPFCPSP